MSRLIYLRSPYFVKASASEGKTITSAQLDLYIWKGDLTDAPTTPTRSLEKSTEDSSNNYVTFEISEICRDELDVSFNGVTRDTEPIYINYELTQTYSDDTSEIYSNIVFGLDGYKDFQEGPQVSENLFKDPSNTAIIDEDDNITISIRDSASGLADREFKTGANLTLTATFTPSNATLQWFKDGDEISGETASTYTITNADTDDDGTYFCRAYLNEGLSTEESEDSNDIVYTLSDCPLILFNPDAQGSNYLSAGGDAGTTISIEVTYNTDCYNAITADSVKMAQADASPFTVTSVTTVDEGDDKVSTVLLTTKKKNVGAVSAKQDRVIITYYDIRKKLNIPKNINVQQLAAAGAITDISFVGSPETNFEAYDAEFIVSGEVGATYYLQVNVLYYDRDNDGKITDEPDYEWISDSDIDVLTGTIEADGDTKHTISLPQNNIAYQRTFNITAINSQDDSNRVSTAEFTQANVLSFAHFQFTGVEFTDENQEDMTFKYFSNTDVEIRVSKGADGFRLISPELSDPGPPKVVFVEETETSVLYRGASALAGTDLTVRAKKNNGSSRDGELSILFEGTFGVLDTLPLTQPGTDDFCIWQGLLDKSSNRTGINTLNIGATATAAGVFGYFIEINSSVPWTVTVPDGIALRKGLLDPIAYGADVSGLAGELSFQLITSEDNPDTETRDFTLTLTSDDDDFESSEDLVVTQAGSPAIDNEAPVFDSITLYDATRTTVLADWVLTDDEVEFDAVVFGKDILEGYGLQAVASDVLAGTITYQWYRVLDFYPDNPSKIDQDGDTFFFTPSSAGKLTYRCLITNTTTGLSRYSDDIVITVSANAAAGVIDWVISEDAVEDQYGNKTVTVPWDGATYTINIVDIADTQTWTWQVTDFTTDLVVPNNSLGLPQEAPLGTGLGPQDTTITFPKNNGTQKFVNVGFYGGPGDNPNVIIKFNQKTKPVGTITSTPSTPQSNTDSTNASSEQTNTVPNETTSTALEDLLDIEKALEDDLPLGGVPAGDATDNDNTGSDDNTVIEADDTATADPDSEGIVNEATNELEDIKQAIDDAENNGEDNDNGTVDDDTDTPISTPGGGGSGGGGTTPGVLDKPEKGFGGGMLL